VSLSWPHRTDSPERPVRPPHQGRSRERVPLFALMCRLLGPAGRAALRLRSLTSARAGQPSPCTAPPSARGASSSASTATLTKLLLQLADQPTRFFVADREVRHLETAPACLALGKRQVPRAADDLSDSRVAKQMWVDRRYLASRTIFRGAQRQDPDAGPFGRFFDNQPGLVLQ